MKAWLRINPDDLTDVTFESEGGRDIPFPDDILTERDGRFVLVGPIELRDE